MSNTFCVTITECKTNEDKATVGFVVANAALGSEKDTMVFLSVDGVWAAVKSDRYTSWISRSIVSMELAISRSSALALSLVRKRSSSRTPEDA